MILYMSNLIKRNCYSNIILLHKNVTKNRSLIWLIIFFLIRGKNIYILYLPNFIKRNSFSMIIAFVTENCEVYYNKDKHFIKPY